MDVSHAFHGLASAHHDGKEGTKRRELGKMTARVLEAITSKWPANPLEVASELGENSNAGGKKAKTNSSKALSSRYLYHFRKLHGLGLIDMKKLGNTYVAWPMDMERLRVLHEMLREGD